MGRPNGHPANGPAHVQAPPPASSSSCCGCKACSWMLYLLVLLSLSLSVMVFWMSLVKQQEVNRELLKMKRIHNETIQEHVESQVAQLRWSQSHLEKKLSDHDREIDNLKRFSDEMVARQHHSHEQHKSSSGGHQRRHTEMLEQINDMKTAFDARLQGVAEKITGWETANEVTLLALNRMKNSLDLLEAELLEKSDSFKDAIHGLKKDTEQLWDMTEIQAIILEQQNKTLADAGFQVSSLQAFRIQLMSELIQNETASARRFARLETTAKSTSEKLSALSVSSLEFESDLALLMNTTSFLERLWHQRLQAEQDRMDDREKRLAAELLFQLNQVNVSLHEKLDDFSLLAATTSADNQTIINAIGQDAPLLFPSDLNSSGVLSADEQLLLDSLQTRLEASEETLAHIDTWRQQTDTNLATLTAQGDTVTAAARANSDHISQLFVRVNHFVQSFIKVKKLPAAMNELDRRIESLDESLNNTIHILAELSDKDVSGFGRVPVVQEAVLLGENNEQEERNATFSHETDYL